jgi:hypothetical protein
MLYIDCAIKEALAFTLAIHLRYCNVTVFRRITRVMPSEQKHSSKLGTGGGGAVSGAASGKACKGLEAAGAHMQEERRRKTV